MIKLQKILAPTDFSDFSLHAMRYSCELAKRFDAELHVLHVINDVMAMPDPLMGAPVADSEIRDLQHRAETEMGRTPPADWIDGSVNVSRIVLFGSPFVEIVRYAKQNDIDLIVLGTHGRTGLSHVLVGSTAERVVRKAPCPVLSVRPEGHDFVMP